MSGMSTIGQRVRQARQEKKLSIEALAASVGMGKGTLGDLELGESKSTTKLHRLAAQLGVRVEWLETGRGAKTLDATPNATSEVSTAHLSTELPPAASQAVRPDFERMAAAVYLLREFLSNAMFDPELVSDARMLEMAYDGVEHVGSDTKPSNVLDFMKYMRQRMEERGVSVRQVEDQAVRAGAG
jgi:transcriptional regulator with XRE-family HTH domain